MNRHLSDDVCVAYAAGELDRGAEAAADRHAAECDECAARLARALEAHTALLVLAKHTARPARRSLRWWGGGLAMAAALLLTLQLRPVDNPPAPFELTLAGGVASNMGDAPKRAYVPGGVVLIRLRPAVPQAHTAAVQAFYLDASGPHALASDVNAADSGAIELRATLPAEAAGQLALLIALGPEGESIPPDVLAEGTSGATTAGSWRFLRHTMTVDAP